MIKKIINGVMLFIKWLFFAAWAAAVVGIVVGIPYRIATVGWDEFMRPAREATSEMVPQPPTPHD